MCPPTRFCFTRVLLVVCVWLWPIASLRAELLLPAQHSWAVEGVPAADEVVEYLICDFQGACESLGLGDRSKAGSPITLQYLFDGPKKLRARYCRATSQGISTGDCGPLSAASSTFRYDSALHPEQVEAFPRGPRGGSVRLGYHDRIERSIPLGFSLPLADPQLHIGVDSPSSRTRIRIRVVGAKNRNRTYLIAYARRLNPGPTELSWPFPRLSQALRDGEEELIVRLDMLRGEASIGNGGSADTQAPVAPHVTTSELFGTLVQLFDADQDGVPAWPALGHSPCPSARWQDCSDNCVEVYNPDQSDSAGTGHGDVCQPTKASPSSRR